MLLSVFNINKTYFKIVLKFYILNTCDTFLSFSVLYLPNSSGKRTALLNGHTFYCDGRGKNDIWYCTKRNVATNCKTRFIATKNGEITQIIDNGHKNPPPNYIIRDGVYIRL